MKTKTNGKELKTFWNLEEPWWPKDGFVEDDYYEVNGVEKGDSWEPLSAADDDQITIMSGVICDGASNDEGSDLQTVFRKWRKSLTTRTVLVEVDAFKMGELIHNIKQVGGKIIS